MALSAVRKYRRAHTACEKAVLDLHKAQERVEEASARQARAQSELVAVMSEAVMSAFPDMPRDPDGFIQFLDDIREGYALLMRQREAEAPAVEELVAEEPAVDDSVVELSADDETPDVVVDEQAADAQDDASDVGVTSDEQGDVDS